MLFLSVLGYVMTNVVTLAGAGGGPQALLSPGNLAHLGATVVFLVVWLIARGGRLALPMLRILDGVGTVLPAVLFDVMALHLPIEARPDLVSRHLVMLLVTTNMLIARAVLVPSRPGFTALLGSAAAVAAIVGAYFVDGVGRPTMRVAYAFTWSLFAVLTSTFTSHVIYGLRRRVREAARLGQYTLVEKLGSGGMGVVYRAEHAMLRRPTAIKLLDRNQVGELGLARFEREVQLTAQLTHPNTIAIYDYGRTADGIFYYAMELVDGLDLEELVRRHGAQPIARVVHLIRQACGSLAEAHAMGLVHRDIKPSNLVVTLRRGQGDVLKVLDFGLVKDVREGEKDLSVTGAILGTPLYLSPEAISAPDRVGPASDLYALGAVAYFLVTGRPVFQGSSIVELCTAHLSQAPVPPSQLGVELPAALERAILQCLAKNPNDRPQSAEVLSDLLADCGVSAWSREDAERWWATHAQVGSAPAPPLDAEDLAHAQTVHSGAVIRSVRAS
jgi:serine/threonine-protein kinase